MSENGQPAGEPEVAATGLGRFADSVEDLLRPIYTWVGYLGAVVLGGLVVAMMYSIIGRRFFGTPLPGSSDILELSLLVMTFTVMGIEHLGPEKMICDALIRLFPQRAQRVIAPIMFVLAIIMLSILCWQVIVWGIKLQSRGETTPGTLAIPKFPFAYLAAYGIFTLIPSYLILLLKSIDRLVKR